MANDVAKESGLNFSNILDLSHNPFETYSLIWRKKIKDVLQRCLKVKD